jgi:hypothetical protein
MRNLENRIIHFRSDVENIRGPIIEEAGQEPQILHGKLERLLSGMVPPPEIMATFSRNPEPPPPEGGEIVAAAIGRPSQLLIVSVF